MKNTDCSRHDGELVSLSLFGEIFDEVPSGLIVLDGSGRVARTNRAAESLLGEPLEGRPWREIIQRLKRGGITRFLLLFRRSRSRSELVATFMAVLELCRNNLIRLAGSASDCTVTCEGDVPEEMM